MDATDRPAGTGYALNDWDTKVALRAAMAEDRAAVLSERLGVDVKALPKLGRVKPNRLTTGALEAIRSGAAIVDELGHMRCPPGTPGAMQFTDFLGTGCDVPAGGRRAFTRPVTLGAETLDEVSSMLKKPERARAILSTAKVRKIEDSILKATPTIGDADFGEMVDDIPVVGDWRKGVLRIIKAKGGITISPMGGQRPTSGWAIARDGQGVRIRVDDLFDADGQPELKAVALIHAFIIDAHKKGRLQTPQDRRAVGTFIGAWIDKDSSDGIDYLYLDITEVFDKKTLSREKAVELGKKRNQLSVADLDAITAEDWDNAFVESGGDGSDFSDFGIDARSIDRVSGTESPRVSGDDRGPLVDQTSARVGKGGRVRIESDDPAMFSVDNVDEAHVAKMEAALEEQLPKAIDGYEGPVGGIDGIEARFADLLGRVTERDFQEGLTWYPGAREMIDEIASRLNVEPWQAAALMAVLSPGRSWDQNTWQARFIAQMVEDNPVLTAEFAALIDALRLSDFETKLDDYARGARDSIPSVIDVDAQKFVGMSVRDLMKSEDGLDVLALFVRAYGKATARRDHGPDSKWRPDQVILENEKTITSGEDWWEAPQWQSFDNLRKAVQVLAADGEDYALLDSVLGSAHKVRSFFNNIMFPYDGRDSTIDVHMGSIGTGAKITSGNKPASDLIFSKPSNTTFGTRGTYPLFQIALRRTLNRFNDRLEEINAARADRDLPPLPRLDIAQLQAILWVAHRRAPFGEGLDELLGALVGVSI